jgi:dienelactone hydrolase
VNQSSQAGPPGPGRRGAGIPGARRRPRASLRAAALAALATGVLVAACAGSGGAGAGHAAAPSGPATPSASPRPSPPVRLPVGKLGRYAVAEQSLTIVDRSRPRLGPRVIPTVVRYPVIPAAAASATPARGLFPLVVFAPGYRQCDRSYRFLLHEWASAGYVIAAVEFPRTNCHVSAPDESDLVNQPGDVSGVIGQLVAISHRPHGPLAGLVNPAQIGVAGHSDGGDTAAAVAANTCCRDHRVAAAVVLVGAEWPPMPGRYFARPAPPMLFVQGTDDTWNPPETSKQLYRADTTGPRYYLDLFGADHFTPYEGRSAPEPIVARVTTDFLNRYLAGQRPAAAAMRRAGQVAGVAALATGGHLPRRNEG